MTDNFSDISFAKAKMDFLESLAHSRSPRTVQSYNNALETFSNMLLTQNIDILTFPVRKLEENSIADFVLITGGLSTATESLYLQVIKNFFEFLYSEHLSGVNVSKVRKIIRQRSRRTKSALSEYPENDLKRLIEYMSNIAEKPKQDLNQAEVDSIHDKRDSALILTLADTGSRVEEVCKLSVGDIDWIERCAVVRRRGSKESFVRFSTRAVDAIKEYIDFRSAQNINIAQHVSQLPLFARHDKGAGKKIIPITSTTVRIIIADRVREILGEDAIGTITHHTFLHHFLTTILRATGNLKLAQELARHSNIQVTQRYAHLSDDELDKGYYEILRRKSEG